VDWFNNFMRECFLPISTQTSETFNLNFAAPKMRSRRGWSTNSGAA